MSSYIKQAACGGRRPAHLGQLRGVQRPDLVARLLRERRRPRFIFAPNGYGKTLLAADYCETVFGFSHVFWIRATSPCFIRDLDAGTIAQDVNLVDEDAALVVFDDVPRLDGDRVAALGEQIERFLDRSCEVLVMGAPSSAVCADFFADAMVLHAVDLLLSGNELALSQNMMPSLGLGGQASSSMAQSSRRGSSARASSGRGSAVCAAGRIPALAWSSAPEQLDAFIEGLFKEELEPSYAAAIARIMAIGAGGVSDILGEIPDAPEPAELARDYPHLGIDDMLDGFDCSIFPVETVMAALRPLVRRLASAAERGNSDGMVASWADLACAAGMHERACDIVRLLMASRARGAWASAHVCELVRVGAFLPAKRLVDAVGETSERIRERLAVLELASRLHLEGKGKAVLCVRRLAFSRGGTIEARLVCLAAIARYGQRDLASRALTEIAEILDNVEDGLLEPTSFAATLARGALAFGQGVERLESLLEFECEPPVRQDGDALCIMAAWLFDAYAEKLSAQGEWERAAASNAGRGGRAVERAPYGLAGAASSVEIPSAIVSFVVGRVEDRAFRSGDAFAAAAGLALEQARMQGAAPADTPFSASAMLTLRQVETSLLGQRMRYDLDTARDQDLRVVRLETHPDYLYPKTVAIEGAIVQKRPPVLHVHMFGRLSVSMGDVPVDDYLIRRHKVRKLLVILAVNCGRELARDTICAHLWPKAGLDTARKSFYNILSQLKRALTLPDGTCPYLVRHRLSCALDERIVVTDIMRLDEICREFLFGDPDELAWSELYSEVVRDFGGELIPGEPTDSFVETARDSLNARLVDALTAGSRRITKFGNPEFGIWFARSAIERDRTREDAYIALMIAQEAAQQRPAALYTFQDMRTVLAEELGVDPSYEARKLYERILLADGGEAIESG